MRLGSALSSVAIWGTVNVSLLTPRQAQLVTLSDILNISFRIPKFQRLYAWGTEQWEALVGDLADCWSHSKPLFLGMCVLAQDGEVYDIIDGQQRLTTLAILLGTLEQSSVIQQFPDGRSQLFISPQEPDGSWLRKILNEETVGDPARYSQRLMLNAFNFFKRQNFEFDAAFVKRIELIVYCAPTIFGATSLFERINNRGKEVATIELVKNRLFDWSTKLQNNEITESFRE